MRFGPCILMRSRPLLPGVCLALLCLSSSARAAPPPPVRPVLDLTPGEITWLRERVRKYTWARAAFDRFLEDADAWLKKPRPIPEGESGWYHDYFCPEHAVMLRYDPGSPHAHACPVDGRLWRGAKYDAYWIAIGHSLNMQSLYSLALAYAVTGKETYARAAAELLLDYAEYFPKTKPHGRWAGKGRIMGQSLSEAVLLLKPLKAYALIAQSEALDAQARRKIEEEWFRPAAEFIAAQTSRIHNIHCWHNAAIACAGFVLGDGDLVDFAIRNPRSGFFAQVAKGVTREGFWFERSTGYHFYTLSALEELVLAAERNGLRLREEAPKLKRMYLAPIELADPQFVLHATNDGGATTLTAQAPHYEIASSWYPGEPAFRQVLSYAYAHGAERRSRAALLYGPEELPPPAEGFAVPSRLFPDAGFAVLRHTVRDTPAYLLLDFGEHGGGHGHPDKLNIVLSGLGRTLVPDLGTAGYGIPLNGSWYRRSVSHNVLVVDGKDQRPAAGRCISFHGEGPVRWVTAECGTAYPGVSWRRTACFWEDSLFIVDTAGSDGEHTYDWVFHHFGRIRALRPHPERFLPGLLSGGPAYEHLSNARHAAIENAAVLRFELDRSGATVLHLACASPATLHLAEGPGNPATQRLPAVILRRRAQSVLFAAALEFLPENGEPRLGGLSPRAEGTARILEVRRGGELLRLEIIEDGSVKAGTK